MMVHAYYRAGRSKGKAICTAFAQGCGGKPVALEQNSSLLSGAAAFYGWRPETYHLFRQASTDGRPWIYLDNSYCYGRDEYFRATVNALQHDGTGDALPDRWRRFGVRIKPWRKTGSHIVLVGQSDPWHPYVSGMSEKEWLSRITGKLRLHTDRPIVVAPPKLPPSYGEKSKASGFMSVLPDAWAVVTHSSSCAIQAAVEGVPVFCTAPCAASLMGLSDLSRIETPVYPGSRYQWMSNLCANQWTLDEMRDGTCWRALKERL